VLLLAQAQYLSDYKGIHTMIVGSGAMQNSSGLSHEDTFVER